MNLRQQLQCELARRDFWEYCKLMHPEFYKEDRLFLQDLCTTLQEFYYNDQEVMIINMPPRHGKSFTATNFVEWILGKNPQEKIISASYNHKLSKTFSKKCRNTIESVSVDGSIIYNDIFPNTKIKFGSAEATQWQTDKSNQVNYLASTPNGSATGFGCTMMVIDDVIKNAYEANNEMILDDHWDWFCFEGNTNVNTKDGWKKIKDVKVGDKLLTYNHSRCIIEEKEVIRTNNKLSNIYRLEFENGKVIETTGNHKFYTNKGYREIEEILYSMWGRIEEGQTVLFNTMQQQVKNEQATKNKLFKLQQRDKHRKEEQTEKILFYRMSPTIQNKKLKFEIYTLGQDKERNKVKIQNLSKMWKDRKSPCTSHRPRYKEQRIRQFNGFMSIMPLKLSQATRLPQNDFKRVYDIELKDNHNFFVEGILVHNCDTMYSRREGKKKMLFIMTRWSSKDLAGRILEFVQKEKLSYSHINYVAEQKDGSMLCEDLFSKRDNELSKKGVLMSNEIYYANYQQEPIDMKGALYSSLKTYTKKPEFITIENYTDTADEGKDYLCSIDYGIYNGQAYILDIIFTQDPMEITEPLVAGMITKDWVNYCKIESNNGGKGFGRNVERIARENGNRHTEFLRFTQTKNKVARILTAATGVMQNIYFPEGWQEKYPEFYKQVVSYQRMGKNKHDDAVDVLSGIYENLVKYQNNDGW